MATADSFSHSKKYSSSTVTSASGRFSNSKKVLNGCWCS
jgi:hypothetical protein